MNMHGELVQMEIRAKEVIAAEILCGLKDLGHIKDIRKETLYTTSGRELDDMEVVDEIDMFFLGGEWVFLCLTR